MTKKELKQLKQQELKQLKQAQRDLLRQVEAASAAYDAKSAKKFTAAYLNLYYAEPRK